MTVLSENLKKLRKNKGYNQTKIAEILNISQQAYAKYELGKTEPDINSLYILSEFYNVSLDALLGRNTEISKPIIKPNTITIFGRDGNNREFEVSEEDAKLLETLAQKMLKEQNDDNNNI